VNKGFQGTANTCITHSFPKRQIEAIVGWDDVPKKTKNNILIVLDDIEWSMYDKLVTLCDSLADSKGFSLIEKRIVSAAIRNGANQNRLRLLKNDRLVVVSIYKRNPPHHITRHSSSDPLRPGADVLCHKTCDKEEDPEASLAPVLIKEVIR
jgi:hypothetical protein